MIVLGHAEAHERLMDLTLEPDALHGLAVALAKSRGGPENDPLAAHILSCATCRDVVASWERTHATVRHALSASADAVEASLGELAYDEHVPAPPALRSAILELVEGSLEGEPRPSPRPQLAEQGAEAAPTRRMGFVGASLGRRLLPLAAVLGIVAVAAGLVVNQSARLDEARRETAALEAVAATVDRVLRDPGHRVVDLRAADGVPVGSISWSSQDLVVLTGALPPPPAGKIYACWIERDGVRSPIGQMWFAGTTAYWTGSLDEWATTSFGSGTFGVSLEPLEGPRGHPAVLVGDLGT